MTLKQAIAINESLVDLPRYNTGPYVEFPNTYRTGAWLRVWVGVPRLHKSTAGGGYLISEAVEKIIKRNMV